MLPIEGLIRIVDSIVGPAIPDPSLPFEERWSKADALSNRSKRILPTILPHWDFEGPMAELADSPLVVLYGELKRYIADYREQPPHYVTHLRLMKELVGFIRQVAERKSG